MGFVERSGIARSKTFRLDSDFIDELETEAKKQGISINNLMERIVERYINHIRWIDEIGGLTIHHLTIQKILDELDMKQVAELGESLGVRLPQDRFMIGGISLDDAMARYIVEKILGEYNHWFSASYHQQSRPYFLLQTTLGEKWMMFVEAYLRAFYREYIGKEITCERFGNSLQVLL